jgi:transposase-like protein
MHNLHPETIRSWVRQYRDEVEADMAKRKSPALWDEVKQAKAETEDYRKKYAQAMKLLGEKELEIAILRDLVKKTNPGALESLKNSK